MHCEGLLKISWNWDENGHLCLLLCNECIVIVCCKFGGFGMKMAICVYLCCDEFTVSVYCKFGGITMKMAICVYLCCDEFIVRDC